MNQRNSIRGLRGFIGLGLATLLLAPPAASQSRVGTTAATFLSLGTGARGQSVGHAYTAMATGGDALFWNPSGAARPHLGQYGGALFFGHTEWVADITYDAAGVVVPMGSGVVGLSIAAVDYGRMEVRTVDLPDGTGETFSATDFSLGATYAQPLTNTFYFGGTVKYVRQQIRDMSAQTVAFDFGFTLLTRYLNGATLAASIQNFGGKMRMQGINSQIFVDVDPENSGSNPNIPARIRTDAWSLPLVFKFGTAVPLLDAEYVQFLLLADVNQTNDNNLNGDVGAQLRFRTGQAMLDLRGGYRDVFLDNVDSHASFGGGVDVRVSRVRLAVDYAYLPFDLLGSTQMIDLRIHF